MAASRRTPRTLSHFGRHVHDLDVFRPIVEGYESPHTCYKCPDRPSTAHPLLQSTTWSSSPPTSFPKSKPLRATGFRPSPSDEYSQPPEDYYDVWGGGPGPHLTSGARCSGSFGGRNLDGRRPSSSSGPRPSREGKVSPYPGPGSYETSLKPGGPSFSLGSRDSLKKVVLPGIFSPGPGAYNVKMRSSGPSYSMGPRFRPPMSQKDTNPGPGSYSDLPGAFGQGLSFTMREKLN